MKAALLFRMFCLCVCCVHLAGGSEDDSLQTRPKKRLVLIEELRAKNPFLILDEESYERFVHKGPRPYYVVVLAGPITDPNYSQIKRLIEQLAETSNAYESHLNEQRIKGQLSRDIVFVVTDTAKNAHVLEDHGINGDVAMFILKPTTESGRHVITLPDILATFNFRQSWTPQVLTKWISSSTGIAYTYHTSILTWIAPYALGVGILFMLVVTLKSSVPDLPGPSSPKFWFGICIFVWMLVFSGMHFCVIREVPPFGFDQRSQSILIFHPSPSSQFGLEGLIVTALELIAGMMLVALVEFYPPMNQPPEDKKFLGFMLASATGAMFLVVRYLFFAKQHWV